MNTSLRLFETHLNTNCLEVNLKRNVLHSKLRPLTLTVYGIHRFSDLNKEIHSQALRGSSWVDSRKSTRVFTSKRYKTTKYHD